MSCQQSPCRLTWQLDRKESYQGKAVPANSTLIATAPYQPTLRLYFWFIHRLTFEAGRLVWIASGVTRHLGIRA